MSSTIYLVRHAQSMPIISAPQSRWRLSAVGVVQAEQLALLMTPLRIQFVFSSPFARSVATASPFAERHRLEIVVVDALRERILTTESNGDGHALWCRSWEDFTFAPPSCESSVVAQERFVDAMKNIAAQHSGVAAVFTHGHVISLFLNMLDRGFGRREAELLTNPDVLKIEWSGGSFSWQRDFALPGLADIATRHSQTPKKERPNQPPQHNAGSRPFSGDSSASETSSLIGPRG